MHAPPQKKKLNSRGKYCAYTLQFKLKAIQAVQASDVRTVAKQFKLPRSTLETYVKTYSQDDLKECKSSKGKGKKGAHFKAGAGRPLTYPESMDAELAEWVLHQRDLQRPVSILMLKAKAKAIVSSKHPAFRASKVGLTMKNSLPSESSENTVLDEIQYGESNGGNRFLIGRSMT